MTLSSLSSSARRSQSRLPLPCFYNASKFGVGRLAYALLRGPRAIHQTVNGPREGAGCVLASMRSHPPTQQVMATTHPHPHEHIHLSRGLREPGASLAPLPVSFVPRYAESMHIGDQAVEAHPDLPSPPIRPQHARAHAPTEARRRIRACAHARAHTQAHARKRKHTGARTHKHTGTCSTPTPPSLPSPRPSATASNRHPKQPPPLLSPHPFQ